MGESTDIRSTHVYVDAGRRRADAEFVETRRSASTGAETCGFLQRWDRRRRLSSLSISAMRASLNNQKSTQPVARILSQCNFVAGLPTPQATCLQFPHNI